MEWVFYGTYEIKSDEEGLEIYSWFKSKLGLRVIKEVIHRFEPHGITAVAILGESALVLHTYPEHRTATVFLSSCRPLDLSLIQSCPFCLKAFNIMRL